MEGKTVVKIIDKNKDYYDYLSGIYGIEDDITFDRRGSTILTNRNILDSMEENSSIDLLLLETGFVHYVFKISYEKEIKYILEHTFFDEVHFSQNPVCLYFTRRYNFDYSFFREMDWKNQKLSYKNIVIKNYSKWNKQKKMNLYVLNCQYSIKLLFRQSLNRKKFGKIFIIICV